MAARQDKDGHADLREQVPHELVLAVRGVVGQIA
jgi:hypothetical protein